jgi:MYXO-CTERM domain-containing protein
MSSPPRSNSDRFPWSVAAPLVCAWVILLGAAPSMPQWTDTGAAAGLPGLYDSTISPSWFDLDGDGNPDPIWWNYQGSVTLVQGSSTDALLPLDLPTSLEGSEGPPLLGAVLDADADGTPEILAFGRELVLMGLVGERHFGIRPSVLPTLPAAFVTDMAVGDLNADGLPDLVIALSLYALERIDLSGPPNVALMNLGAGRFELHRIEPAREAFSNGVTLADLDGDGRIDLIESLDTSALSGLSRALLNKTPPGARAPVFEVLETTWDVGTFGMGAAVADINGDGFMDIYNTSQGMDLLTFGGPDGSYTDVTLERGIDHEWGEVNMRTQWSPSVLDLNADGRLDIMVRQGHQGVGLNGLAPVATDLLYLQDDEGHFHRGDPPFDPLAPSMGRHAVAGDRDGDGLPDVALGGLEGSATFWRNDTVPAEGARALTVRFQTSVSAWPPTGAEVIGTCDGLTWSRSLTSGGLMGGAATPEVYAAWPQCTTTPSLEVRWPSGARSVHAPQPEQTTLVVQEPAWWIHGEGQLILDPRDTGAAQACLETQEGALSCCLVEDAPCALPLPDSVGAPVVSLSGALPMAIYPEPGWAVNTSPSPPRPGEDVSLTLMHVGDPFTFEPDTTSVWVDGKFLFPEDGVHDALLRQVRIRTEVPAQSSALQVTFYPLDLLPEVTWTLPTGLGIDSIWNYQSFYPYRVMGGVTEFWNVAVYTTLIRGVLVSDLLAPLALETPEGVDIPVTRQHLEGNVARARLLVDSAHLVGLDEIVFRDRGASFHRILTIPPPMTLEEATATLAHTAGGISKTRAVGDGDMLLLALSLRDTLGRLMQPERDLIVLEADEATPSQPLFLNGATYNLTTALNTHPGAGPGEIRTRTTDGRLLGTYPFERIPANPTDLDMGLSSAALTAYPQGHSTPASHHVTLQGRNVRGELLGSNLHGEVVVDGGEQIGPPALTDSGALKFDLLANPSATELSVRVLLEGQELAVLQEALEPRAIPPLDPQPEEHSPESDAVEPSSSDGAANPEQPPGAYRSSGCGDCSGGPGAPLGSAILVLFFLRARRRRFGST